MTLISVDKWKTLLVVNTDAKTNIWFQPSTIDPPPTKFHTYTLEELLKDWAPTRRH